LTEKIPHDFKLIGLNLSENNSILGWFILATTVVLSIHYIMTALLDMKIYNKENIIRNKTKDTQSEFSGILQMNLMNKVLSNQNMTKNIEIGAGVILILTVSMIKYKDRAGLW
jgi:hypothetical protein